jgi:hypothetical protein
MSGTSDQVTDVPLFQPLGAEHRNTSIPQRNTAWNTTGTGGLKALAEAVLRRNTSRNASGALAQKSCSTGPEQAEQRNEAAPLTLACDFEERAGIVEHDADVPRGWAEGFARLDTAKPISDVPPVRWQRFIDDCGRFLDQRWAVEAAIRLGWEPLQLFGCDRIRPFARIDHGGLLWRLDGGELLALTDTTAVIGRPNGVRHTYRRRPIEPGQFVLAWKLVD